MNNGNGIKKNEYKKLYIGKWAMEHIYLKKVKMVKKNSETVPQNPKYSKIVSKCHKWSQISPNVPTWSKLVQNYLKFAYRSRFTFSNFKIDFKSGKFIYRF